ncbi:MAG: four helix bundle protein [Gemmatimonadales bacterium]
MRDHTSLLAWQEAHAVVRFVIQASRRHWQPWAGSIFGQLQRASLSVQLNIAEGYAQRGKAGRCLLEVAYGSAVETTDLLRLCLEEKLLPAEPAEKALSQSRRTQALVLELIRHVGTG